MTSNNADIKKLPYSKNLQHADKSNPVSIRVYFGGPEAWSKAQAEIAVGLPSLVVPMDRPLTDFRWGMLAGFSVLAIETRETSPYHRLCVARLLAAAGVRDCYLLAANLKACDSIYWEGAKS